MNAAEILQATKDRRARKIQAPYHEKGKTYENWQEMEEHLLATGNKMVLIERMNEVCLDLINGG